MSKKIHTHYDNLKVTRNAPASVIKMAHKALIQEYHPDKQVSETEKAKAERITKLLNEARDVLLDPVKRKNHDDWIKTQEAMQDYSSQHEEYSSPNQTEKTIDKFIVLDGIATDTETGLMWLRFAYGQQWQNNTAVGDVQTVTWKQTFEVAEEFNQQGGYAGFTDWRLPTIDELKTLIDKTNGTKGNYIDIDVFPSNYQRYWSSSSFAYGSNSAWIVDSYHRHDYSSKYNSYAVRLVRGGQ